MSKLIVSVLLSVLLIALHSHVVSATANTMIPLTKDGHAYHRGNLSAKTVVEIFFDLTCPTCLSHWPTLTKVYETYKDTVHFEYRLFPIPSHQQGFIVAKAAQLVQQLGNPDAVYTFFDTAFANQALVTTENTYDTTYNEVVKIVADWAVQGTGVTTEKYYLGMNSNTPVGSQIEMETRYMWKQACIEGAFVAPMTQIDGLKVSGLDTFEDWQAVLDPLVS